VAQIIWFRENGKWRARAYEIVDGKTDEIAFEFC
jgi:hypothetical protein